MPQSSAFFLNYIIIQGFFVALFRVFFPHPGVLIAIFRIFGCCSAPRADTPRLCEKQALACPSMVTACSNVCRRSLCTNSWYYVMQHMHASLCDARPPVVVMCSRANRCNGSCVITSSQRFDIYTDLTGHCMRHPAKLRTQRQRRRACARTRHLLPDGFRNPPHSAIRSIVAIDVIGHRRSAELRTQRQRAQGLWPPSNRLGREAGFVMTCFLAALAMGPISPLLPLAALAYFTLMWTFWRYTVRLLWLALHSTCCPVVNAISAIF